MKEREEMDPVMVVKIHMRECFSEYGEENSVPKNQLNYADQIIQHMKKEHGTGHTLSFEVIFEL